MELPATDYFERAFEAFTGHTPLGWQSRLFERMLDGAVPSVCDLPTGLGKTSVIPIWLIALASQSGQKNVTLPRRLAYIVNRRTVVDQATDVVKQMRARLRHPDTSDTLRHLAKHLRQLNALDAADQEPLAVSTLRGELADNEEWRTDPSRPAIIIGTIDMVGSKLLFSGYGDGPYHRPHHAGLIGQDTLIIHDEAHLTPTFSHLLHSVQAEQRKEQAASPGRRIRVMELSATSRGIDGDVLTLEQKDEQDEIVHDRLDAAKTLHLHPVGKDKNDLTAKLVEFPQQHEGSPVKVLIYVHSPEDAQKVAGDLKKKLGNDAADRIALLTGTIRGNERDQLLTDNPVYRAMLDHKAEPIKRTMYLVSTSAGEVGIDLDADHMICDLTTLDSMIQRLGRVNRRGGKARKARVDVVARADPAKSKIKASNFDMAVMATQEILQRWKEDSEGVVDASPRTLRRLVSELSDQERNSAFSPRPTTSPLTDILLDAWSLTSINGNLPGRPEVAAYLHGLTDDPPETHVAWRKEVALLNKAKEVDEPALSAWFRDCRIESRERLRGGTGRVTNELGNLLKAHQKNKPGHDFRVILLDARGNAEWPHLSQIVEKKVDVRYRTIILPVEAGGLDAHGMLSAELDPQKGAKPVAEIDVAEADANRARGILEYRDGMCWLRSLDASQLAQRNDGEEIDEGNGDTTDGVNELYPCTSADEGAAKIARQRGLVVSRLVPLEPPLEGAEAESKARYLLLMKTPKQSALENPEKAKFKQSLRDHTDSIEKHVERIADALGLEDPIRGALLLAAKWHDHGKDRPVWQRFACNTNRVEPLAKSSRYLHGRVLGGYRHEFGSLLEAAADDEVNGHPERDLVLHLIAAHHGWARPHFQPRAFDHHEFTTGANEVAVAEVMRRFGRLQQQFGRWRLAWLESLLRCADIAASQPTHTADSAAISQESAPAAEEVTT